MDKEEEIKLKIDYQIYKNNNSLQMADDEEVALRLFKTIKDIKAEIVDTGAYEQETRGKTEFLKGIDYCLDIIDQYMTESEGERCPQ